MRNLTKSVLLLAALAGPANAAEASCPAGLICASDPQTVVAAMQSNGYKAQLGKNTATGNPKIDSSASGYNYAVLFYGCESNRDCKSLSFVVTFENDGTNTPELANRWNKENRFSQMAANDDGTLTLTYDVTTIGGLNQTNFADVVDWWSVMLAKLPGFFAPPQK